MATNARIKITAEDRTKRAIKSAQGNLKDLKDVAGKATAAIAGLASGAAFGALIQKQSEFIRINTRMADQLGITTESLTRLQYAITQNTEVTGEQFNEMLQEFNVRMGDAEKGTGPLIDAFKELGLNFSLIKDLNTDEALFRVADAMQSLGDKSRAAFLAEELFAGEAAKSIPLLIQGANALKQYGKEAEKLGLTYSAEEAEKVLEMQKAFSKLEKALEGTATKAILAVSTDLSSWIDEVSESITKLGDYIDQNKGVMNFLLGMTPLGGYKSYGKALEFVSDSAIEAYMSLVLLGKESQLENAIEMGAPKELTDNLRAQIDLLKERISLREKEKKDLGPIKPVIDYGAGVEPDLGNIGKGFFDERIPTIDQFEAFINESNNYAEIFNDTWSSTFDIFKQGVGDAFATAIVEQQSLGDALQFTMREVAKNVISSLVQLGIQQVATIIKTKAAESAANVKRMAEMKALFVASAPAATAVNVATAGSAGAMATASLATAASSMLALSGQFHDGIDYVPKTGSYLLEKGERVIPAKDNKPAMMGGSVNITIQAIDTQNATQVIMQNEPQIVEMIQRAYDSRGQTGGPVR